METFTKYLVVALGSTLGGMLRYFIGSSLISRIAEPFPTATFVINISGSFIIGFFLTVVTGRIDVSPQLRLAVAVGFIGSYTTFSTFEYETIRLMEEGHILQAILNVLLSIVFGLCAVWGGIALARTIVGIPITSNITYKKFEAQAELTDIHQNSGVERDILDSTIEN